jgi:flagellar hook-length control protein FliK
LAKASGSEAGPTTASASIDRVRFVQRVTRAFQAAGDQGGVVRLRLSPPDLGSLQVQISVKHGELSAHIQAETSAAQQVLLDNLPDLRDRLAQQDIRIERFDVDLMDQSPGGMPQTPQGNPDPNQYSRPAVPARVSMTASATAIAEPAGAAPITSNGALNVVI